MGVPAETSASYAKTVITPFYALQKQVSEKFQDTETNFSYKRYNTFEPPLFEREVKKPRQVAWDPYKIVWDEGLGYLDDFDKDIGDVSPNWKYFRGSFPKKPHRKHTQVTA